MTIAIVVLIILDLQMLVSILALCISKKHLKSSACCNRNDKIFPSVTVVIPCCNEKSSVLNRSLISCKRISYPNFDLVLLENSNNEELKKNNMEEAIKYGIRVFNIKNKGSKAAAINAILPALKTELILIVDADQEVKQDILTTLISHMSDTNEVVCVQSSQAYENVKGPVLWSVVSIIKNEIFYRYICNLYELVGISPCLGTNFIIGVDFLNSVGGFPDYSLTEDLALTVAIYRQKKKVRYISKILGKGIAPTTISSYIAQQIRWSKGTAQVFKKNYLKERNPRLLFLLFSFSLYYLLGGAVLASIIFQPQKDYFFVQASLFLSSIVILLLAVLYRKRWSILELALITIFNAPFHIFGFVSGVFFRKRGAFIVTKKGDWK